MENGKSDPVNGTIFPKRKLADTSIVRKLKRIKTKLKADMKMSLKKRDEESKDTLKDDFNFPFKVLKSKDSNRHSMMKIRKKKASGDKEKETDTMLLYKASGSGTPSCDIPVDLNALISEKKTERKRIKNKKRASLPEDDNDERCAATKCLKPTGEVNWVQCDGGCELWFHLVCVGLNAHDVSETEDYICLVCGRQKNVGEDFAKGWKRENELHDKVQVSVANTLVGLTSHLLHVKREVTYDSDSNGDTTKETASFIDGPCQVLKES